MKFNRQRKTRSLRLARERDCDHRARAFIEHIVTEDQYGAAPCLFISSNRVKVCPPDLSS